MSAPHEIVQLKIRLLGISPMVWRRVLVPTALSLRELHGVIQVAMGWEGIHLFLFDVRAVQYGSFDLHVHKALSLPERRRNTTRRERQISIARSE